MLRLDDAELECSASRVLEMLQSAIDKESSYEAKVRAADLHWASKTSTSAKAATFRAVRATLSRMCIGSVRCSYCEDSAADEIEHIRPKSIFPSDAFKWKNYLYACGPCNSPKGNRFAVLSEGDVVEIARKRGEPVVPPPLGLDVLINPRKDDPLHFLELDLGGVTPSGTVINGTFEFLPSEQIGGFDKVRAIYTIGLLKLNREVVRAARENAYGGFRARLREYVLQKDGGATASRLNALKKDILSAPHLTVFAEMRRQKEFIPEMAEVIPSLVAADSRRGFPDAAHM
jgi:hypothetical protein